MISQKIASLEARIARLEGKKASAGLMPKSPSQINYVSPNVEDVAHMIQIILDTHFHRFVAKQDRGEGLIHIMDNSLYNIDTDVGFALSGIEPEFKNSIIANMRVFIALSISALDDIAYRPYGVDFYSKQTPVITYAKIAFEVEGKAQTVEVSFGKGTNLKLVKAQMKPLIAFYNKFQNIQF
jgi:hypothetical protein